jgi:hypothetical protein
MEEQADPPKLSYASPDNQLDPPASEFFVWLRVLLYGILCLPSFVAVGLLVTVVMLGGSRWILDFAVMFLMLGIFAGRRVVAAVNS